MRASIENILEYLKSIDEKIDMIDNRLSELNSMLNNEVVPSTTKMSTHIDFIERTYTKVSAPLHFICNRVNRYISNDQIKND